MILVHELFLAALSMAALPEIQWFKWTYFHELPLLFPQRCCQGHGAAVKGMALLTRGPGFPRGWERRVCATLLVERHFENLRRFHERIYHVLL
jgi:hypothetical protein